MVSPTSSAVTRTAALCSVSPGSTSPAGNCHQQYLHKNPGGYCNHSPNGLTCPVGIVRQDQLPAQQDVLPPV